jgi:hypothetical protein
MSNRSLILEANFNPQQGDVHGMLALAMNALGPLV